MDLQPYLTIKRKNNMITVAQLIEQLQKFPQNYIIVMSKDGEGNNYSPLSDIVGGNYIATTP